VVSEGTGRRLGAATEGIPLAGKTGTVGSAESNRDAWMAAYNSEYSAAVWMGYDDSSDGKALPTSVTGGTYPAKFLAAVFNHIYEGKTAPQFVAPNNVKTYRLDKYSLENFHEAVLATALTPNNSVLNEIFIEGTEPASTSEYWTVPLPPQNVKLTQDSADMLPVIEFTTVSEFAVYQLLRTDYEGNTVMLNQWNGRAGTVKYKDTSARFGSEYSYYILPVHPELTINGSRVTGAKSRVLTIEMPDFMFTSNEQPQTPESRDAPQVP
jgi:membrane peptidoglycan carboxypeptidase